MDSKARIYLQSVYLYKKSISYSYETETPCHESMHVCKSLSHDVKTMHKGLYQG